MENNNNVIEEVQVVENKEVKTLYCSCGNELVGVKFCSKCGKSAELASEVNPNAQQPKETKIILAKRKDDEPKKNTSAFVHSILSIIFILTGFMFMIGFSIKAAQQQNPNYMDSAFAGLIICSLYPMIGATIVGIISLAKAEKYTKSSYKWGVISLIVGIVSILVFVISVILYS